jgi:hypothetical protein
MELFNYVVKLQLKAGSAINENLMLVLYAQRLREPPSLIPLLLEDKLVTITLSHS